MQITARDAAAFFQDPSQRLFGLEPEYLPDDGFEYWACENICGVFHEGPMLGNWMLHFGAKPEGWGFLVPPAKRVLHEFWELKQPGLIMGWTPSHLRAAIALSKRVGFVEYGRVPLGDTEIVISGWRP